VISSVQPAHEPVWRYHAMGVTRSMRVGRGEYWMEMHRSDSREANNRDAEKRYLEYCLHAPTELNAVSWRRRESLPLAVGRLVTAPPTTLHAPPETIGVAVPVLRVRVHGATVLAQTGTRLAVRVGPCRTVNALSVVVIVGRRIGISRRNDANADTREVWALFGECVTPTISCLARVSGALVVTDRKPSLYYEVAAALFIEDKLQFLFSPCHGKPPPPTYDRFSYTETISARALASNGETPAPAFGGKDWVWGFPTSDAIAVLSSVCTPTTVVRDPFFGWGGRAAAAHALGVHYDGVDSNPHLIGFACGMMAIDEKIHLRIGDARGLRPLGPADVLFTSPPWGRDLYSARDAPELTAILDILEDWSNGVVWTLVHGAPEWRGEMEGRGYYSTNFTDKASLYVRFGGAADTPS
jgi:hypothetical protein